MLTRWRGGGDPRPWWALAALTAVLVAALTTYPTDGQAGFWLVVSLVLLWRVTAGSRTAWLACLVLLAGGAVLFGYVAVAAALPGSDFHPAAHAGSLAGAYALGTLALLAPPVRARLRGEVLSPGVRASASVRQHSAADGRPPS